MSTFLHMRLCLDIVFLFLMQIIRLAIPFYFCLFIFYFLYLFIPWLINLLESVLYYLCLTVTCHY